MKPNIDTNLILGQFGGGAPTTEERILDELEAIHDTLMQLDADAIQSYNALFDQVELFTAFFLILFGLICYKFLVGGLMRRTMRGK